MTVKLDLRLFAFTLKSKRGDKTLRELAKEIKGVSFPTLSRLERKRMPDVNTYLRLCKWMNLSADYFIKLQK